MRPNNLTGAYLDNGLGCFVTAELARLVAANPALSSNVRCLFTFAGFEEIGRFGSRVLAAQFKPDVLIAVDVNHDYVAAPNVGDKRFPSLEMGAG
jgi:putative aminopeptidase FrvX